MYIFSSSSSFSSDGFSSFSLIFINHLLKYVSSFHEGFNGISYGVLILSLIISNKHIIKEQQKKQPSSDKINYSRSIPVDTRKWNKYHNFS